MVTIRQTPRLVLRSTPVRQGSRQTERKINPPWNVQASGPGGDYGSINEEKPDGPDPTRKEDQDARIGYSLAIGTQPWSKIDTDNTTTRVLSGTPYPLPGAAVLVSGKRRRGKTFHDPRCAGLYCLTDSGKVFHGGVHVTTAGEARIAGYSPCRICGGMFLQRRGG